jgi:hypothetical protein
MPTFLDESGDTGHAADSSRHFFLAVVVIPAAAAGPFREAVADLRRGLGVRASYEFKWHLTGFHPDRRRGFFRVAREAGFRFAVCSVDKAGGRWAGAGKGDIYHATTTTLAATVRPWYAAEEAASGRRLREPVTVDDNSDPEFLDAVKAAFCGLPSVVEPKAAFARPPRFGNSATDDLLQLADMACGAVRARLGGDPTWLALLAGHGLGPDVGWGEGVTCW